MKYMIWIIAILAYSGTTFSQNKTIMIDQLKAIMKDADSNAILKFVAANPDVLYEQDEKKVTGLMLIAYNSDKETIKAAAELKHTLTFYEAIVTGNKAEIEKQLMLDTSLINSFAPDGFTPIALACFFEQTEIVPLLIRYGADPNISANNTSKVNALHAAVAKNNYELCKILIEAGTDVNAVQMENVTALHSAAHRGNMQIVKLLTEHGADINMKMSNGDTAIMIATKDQHKDVADYLNRKREK